MPKPISNKVAVEYTPGKGIHFPESATRSRGILPSFADTTLSLTHVEPITIPIAIGSLGANVSTTLSGKQALTLSSLQVAGTDVAQILFCNVSVSAPANVIVGHPNLAVTSNQGTPVSGVLAPGQFYSSLTLSASLVCQATSAGSSAGTVIITAQAMVLGTSTR